MRDDANAALLLVFFDVNRLYREGRTSYMIVYEEGHGIDIKQQLIGHYVTVSRYRTRYTQAPWQMTEAPFLNWAQISDGPETHFVIVIAIVNGRQALIVRASQEHRLFLQLA